MINVDGENMGIKLRYQQHMAIHQWFFWVARRFGEFERPQIIKSPK